MDLTKITTPFGLLDTETQDALRRAFHDGAKIDYWSGDEWAQLDDDPCFFGRATYRVRPEPERPPIELPWEVIDKKFKWAAQDANLCGLQEITVFTHEPEIEIDFWVSFEGHARRIDGLFPNIRINVTDWRQSLTKRPEDK